MPAQLLLRCFRQQAEKLFLVGLEQLRRSAGDFLGRVGGAHADHGIGVPQAVNQRVEEAWAGCDKAGDGVGIADAAAIASGKPVEHFPLPFGWGPGGHSGGGAMILPLARSCGIRWRQRWGVAGNV